MTTISPDQFAIVLREVESMFDLNELDEAWRVMKMFADERFNFTLADFPAALTSQFADLGHRSKKYTTLIDDIRTLKDAFDVSIIGSVDGHELVKLVSRSPADALPICLVAGIHGDEPDGILASLQFARRFAASRELAGTYALTIYPCINPVGYERMTRFNGRGKDINREFLTNSTEPEVVIMERELQSQSFAGFIGGHSDYESFGLYAYATGAVLSERLAKPALFQASGVIPINTDPVIDGHPAEYGIINQTFPGSLGLLGRGASDPFEITIETPNLFALHKRVEAQTIAFETILQEYRVVATEGMYL